MSSESSERKILQQIYLRWNVQVSTQLLCFHQSHWSKRDQEQRDKGGDFCYQSIGRDKKPSHGIILPQGDQLQLYFMISVSQTQNMQ